MLAGAVLFGAGWGLVGLCPGPAIVNLATLSPAVLLFVAAMLAGIGVGIYKDDREAYACVRRDGPAYTPDASCTERYAKAFERYKMVYPALAPVSHAISDAMAAGE